MHAIRRGVQAPIKPTTKNSQAAYKVIGGFLRAEDRISLVEKFERGVVHDGHARIELDIYGRVGAERKWNLDVFCMKGPCKITRLDSSMISLTLIVLIVQHERGPLRAGP